jgi:aryl-alcohol dehydrogenase-like predicted oxidoreductase
MSPTKTKLLGTQGLQVSAVGLGCMNLTGHYDDGPSSQVAESTLDRAIGLGVTFFDTADIYGDWKNEELIGRVISGRRDAVQIATKCGLGTEVSATGANIRGDAAYIKESCDGSLRRLGTDYIDLYFMHRVDPNVPIEESVGAMADLVAAGKIRYVGLCEAAPDTLRRAHAIHPLSVVESEWSLWSRDLEREVVPTARELGIGIVPYAPLGRGFLTGKIQSLDDLAPNDSRRRQPRFAPDNFAKNLELLDRIRSMAAEKECTTPQLALAWLNAQGEDVVPIPGADHPDYVVENAGALDVVLTAEDLAHIDDVIPRDLVVGDRYADMSWVGGTTPGR